MIKIRIRKTEKKFTRADACMNKMELKNRGDQ